MSCNVGHATEPRESASSQLPEVSDCRRGGSGDPPFGHDNHVEHQQVIQDLRRKKGHVGSSGDKGNDSDSSGEAAKHLKECLTKVSFHLQLANEETRAAFKDLGDMSNSIGIVRGTGVSERALSAAVDWLNLEARQDLSGAVELEREEEILRNIESSMGYCTDEELDNDGEGVKRTLKAPQEISKMLDTLDEHAMNVGNPKVQEPLRQVREGSIPGSLEERIVQPHGTGMVEIINLGFEAALSCAMLSFELN